MWEINNSFQIFTFLASIIVGIIYCAFYDIFRALRYVKNFNNFIVFIQDIFYFFIISVTTFIYLLSTTNGQIRFYVLVGILLGFIIFLTTFSRYFIFVINKILTFFIWLKNIFLTLT